MLCKSYMDYHFYHLNVVIKASQRLIQQPLTCLCVFYLKDTDTKGRFSSPVLDVTEKQLIIERNQTLQLNCR